MSAHHGAQPVCPTPRAARAAAAPAAAAPAVPAAAPAAFAQPAADNAAAAEEEEDYALQEAASLDLGRADLVSISSMMVCATNHRCPTNGTG